MAEIDKALAYYNSAFKEMKKKKPDEKKAYALLSQSADGGCAKAIYAIATWYLHGTDGLPTDLKKGVELLEEAVNKKNPDAMFDLAICYERGKGKKKNLKKAFELYLMAALREDKQSIYEVFRCYYYGIGVEANEWLADIWLERAEELQLK